MARLTFQSFEGSAGQFVLVDPLTRIGRSTHNDLVLNDDSVSGIHACILRAGKSVSITDLGSTNGTYVNNERVNARLLLDGDEIALGNARLRYFSKDRSTSQTDKLGLRSIRGANGI